MALELTSVALSATPIDRYPALLDDHVWAKFEQAMRAAAAATSGRVVWNVNSTARGGGVAELLAALLPYERGVGIDARWVVIDGSRPFFDFTKRLHALLHGFSPDGTAIEAREREVYESTLAENAQALVQLVRPQDIVVLHDPQTAGLAPALARQGCRLIWRCHIGIDEPSDMVRRAWHFLRPFVSAAEVLVFSRRAYVWEGLDPTRVEIIRPSLDAFTPKNQDMDQAVTRSILRMAGLLDSNPDGHAASFLRNDGTTGRVTRKADVIEVARLTDADPVVAQVSRWDRLKDPAGVMEGFVRNIDSHAEGHLVLAGPAIGGVGDDPEQPAVMRELLDRWEGLEQSARRRVHIARLPMDDTEENAAVVNALQRRADIVVQKSIAEGFGLTVAEAMWKSRPVVASRVGGIGDQIEDGKSGVLVTDPRDLATFGKAISRLLGDPEARQRLGEEARRRAGREFLAPRQLIEQANLLRRLAAHAAG